MQKMMQLLRDWVWPAGLAAAALLGLLHARGYNQLECLPNDVRQRSPDIGYLLASNEVAAYMLLGLVWGAVIQQVICASAAGGLSSGKKRAIALWAWAAATTVCAIWFALQRCRG